MALNKAPQSMLDLASLQTVNVKDYGAVGNGVTNDYTAFVNALSAVNASGGGAVIVPPGTYMIGQPLLLKGYENVNLVGSGIGATVLTKNNNFDPSIRFYLGQNNSVSRLTLNCDGYDGRGILFQDINSFAEYVEVLNCPDRPLAMNGGSNTVYGLDSEGRESTNSGFTAATFFPARCRILNCKIYNSGRTALSQKQMPYSEITGNYVEIVYSEGVTADKCDYSTITNNVFVNVARRGRNTAWPDKVNGGQIFSDAGGGIGGMGLDGSAFLKVANNAVIGVQLDEATVNNRSSAAIRIRPNLAVSSGNIISGNTIEDAKMGVWINAGEANNATDNIITNNTFKTIGTAVGTGSSQYGDIWIGESQNNNFVADNAKVGGNLLVTDLGSNNTIFPEFEKPFVILALGEANMAGTTNGTGGDYTVDPDVYLWDTDVATGTCVFGTKFQRATFGVAPLNQETGGQYWQSLAYQTAKNIRQRINKKVYVVQVARASHSIEAFLSDSVLSANSWSRGADQDLSSLMYPGLSTALAAVPGAPSIFDAVIWQQGTSNASNGADLYARKLVAVIDELDSNSVINKNTTVFAAGQLPFSSGIDNFERHTWGLKRTQYERKNVRIAFSNGIEIASTGSVNFNGNGITSFGKVYADALFSPENKNEIKDLDLVYGPNTGYGGWCGTTLVQSVKSPDRGTASLSAITNQFVYTNSISRTFSLRERTANVARITLAASHALISGQAVNVTCPDDTSFSANNVVVTVIDAYTFTYANTGSNVSSTADSTGTASYVLFGNGGYSSKLNTNVIYYTRKIFKVPQTTSVKITYEIAVDSSGGTVSTGSVPHRAQVYQYTKNFGLIGVLSSTPTNSPLVAANGRVVVTRSFGRPGVACDAFLDARTEYVAIGFNFANGGSNEPFYSNILDIVADEYGDEVPEYKLLENDSGDANAGPILDFYRNSVSPAANDLMGRMLFRGRDSAGNSQDYAAIQAVIDSPTSGSETGSIVFATTTGGTLTNQARVSSGGNLEVFGAGKIGYATGSGGTVTQATSKATAVTIDKTNGSIVTAADSLGNGSRVFFTVNNSTVAATDTVIAHRASGGTANGYEVLVMQVAAGSFGLEIINISGGALSESITINFAVIKAVIS
jgi:parallel beta-helix repeat protein